jgi:molecular chaperone GrpE
MEYRMGWSMGNDEKHPAQVTEPPADIYQSGKPVISDPDCNALKKQFNDLNDRFLRLAADFENFRKRTARDREIIVQSANERFALDMLDVFDSLERAVRYDDAHLREGLIQIRELCSAALQRHGITPVDAFERKFNPAEHEAVAHIPSDKQDGVVIEEITRGYRMHDRVIRYAKVAVSKGKEN